MTTLPHVPQDKWPKEVLNLSIKIGSKQTLTSEERKTMDDLLFKFAFEGNVQFYGLIEKMFLMYEVPTSQSFSDAIQKASPQVKERVDQAYGILNVVLSNKLIKNI